MFVGCLGSPGTIPAIGSEGHADGMRWLAQFGVLLTEITTPEHCCTPGPVRGPEVNPPFHLPHSPGRWVLCSLVHGEGIGAACQLLPQPQHGFGEPRRFDCRVSAFKSYILLLPSVCDICMAIVEKENA